MEHLVNICAKRAYRRYVAGNDSEKLISLDDLKHAGIIGYLEAEGRFDESKGVDRKTFLGYRVRGAIIDWLRKQPMVSLPQVQYGKVKALRECREKLMKDGLDGTDEEVAVTLGIDVDEVHGIDASTPHVRSLNRQYGDEGISEMDLLPASGPQPLDTIVANEVAHLIDICLKNLSASDDRLILLARMQQDIKLRQLAKQFDCTPQAIHQREKRALEKMKKCLQSNGWQWDQEEDFTTPAE